jgi:hypothetical protein
MSSHSRPKKEVLLPDLGIKDSELWPLIGLFLIIVILHARKWEGEPGRMRVLFLTTVLSVRSVAPIYSSKWNSCQGDGAELLRANN